MVVVLLAMVSLIGSCRDESNGNPDLGTVVEKMRECGLLGEGRVNLSSYFEDDSSCILGCVTTQTCSIVEWIFCEEETGMPSSLESCLERCGIAVDDGFVCASGDESVPGDWACDGEEDCLDGSDEWGCEDSMFQCADGSEEIPNAWVCDYERDCEDGSDERDCEYEMFACPDGEFIPAVYACDGYPDCLDGSDERGCEVVVFECADGELISKDWECDLQEDCEDGSDEWECAQLQC